MRTRNILRPLGLERASADAHDIRNAHKLADAHGQLSAADMRKFFTTPALRVNTPLRSALVLLGCRPVAQPKPEVTP